MAGRIVRNRTHLPKLDKIRDGGDWQPGDQQNGLWSRQAIEDIDSRFKARMIGAIRDGRESAEAISATIRTATKRP
jgi:hypothetical protein